MYTFQEHLHVLLQPGLLGCGLEAHGQVEVPVTI